MMTPGHYQLDINFEDLIVLNGEAIDLSISGKVEYDYDCPARGLTFIDWTIEVPLMEIRELNTDERIDPEKLREEELLHLEDLIMEHATRLLNERD